MKVIILAAPVKPVAGETLESNLDRARHYYKKLRLENPDAVVLAPWILDCEVLNDEKEEERAIGMAHSRRVVELVGLVTRIPNYEGELQLRGPRISSGMAAEVALAKPTTTTIKDSIGGCHECGGELGRNWWQGVWVETDVKLDLCHDCHLKLITDSVADLERIYSTVDRARSDLWANDTQGMEHRWFYNVFDRLIDQAKHRLAIAKSAQGMKEGDLVGVQILTRISSPLHCGAPGCRNEARYVVAEGPLPTYCGLCDIKYNDGRGRLVSEGGGR